MHCYRVVRRPAPRILSVLAMSALLLLLSNCSFGSTTGPRHLVIATLFAASGMRAPYDLPAQYAVDLAVSQAHLPDGYTLSVESKDEAYGSSNDFPFLSMHTVTSDVQTLVNNTSVVGIVGPFDGYGATLAMPIINQAGLSMIDPFNTTPSLTLKPYALPLYGFNWAVMHPAMR
jgi:ABC-type branched-subunit amino acid transport system substrate-binding protein